MKQICTNPVNDLTLTPVHMGSHWDVCECSTADTLSITPGWNKKIPPNYFRLLPFLQLSQFTLELKKKLKGTRAK